MELHLALKNIVNLSGTSILKEQRLVNILADFSAYDEIPAYKHLLKTAIEEHFVEDFVQEQTNNVEESKTVSRYIQLIGCKDNYAIYLFNSIAYSLGWVKDVSPIIILKETQQGNKFKTNKSWDSMSEKERNLHLESLVEWKIDMETVAGIKTNSVSFEAEDGYWLRMNYFIEGDLTVDEFYPQISFLDSANKLLLCTNFIHIKKSEFSGYDSLNCSLAVEPRDIARIVIYWKK